MWYVYPIPRQIKAYTALDRCDVVGEQETLSGGTVLPGFRLSLQDYFAEPGPDAT